MYYQKKLSVPRRIYNDSSRELNMIYGLDHERIMRFFVIKLQPVGFVMEQAGLVSLDDVI